MTSRSNPFTPGPGTPPEELFGREEILKKVREEVFYRILDNRPAAPAIFYGFRGVGKTVLLNQLERDATDLGIIAFTDELSETDNFRSVIFERCRSFLFQLDRLENFQEKARRVLRILKGISLNYEGFEVRYDIDLLEGEGDSGTFQLDLVTLMLRLGELALEKGKALCFLFDELQHISESDKAAFLAAAHKVSQRKLPIGFVCAGLPQLVIDSAAAKSYAERLRYISIGSLSREDSYKVIQTPFVDAKVDIPQSILESLYENTQGYPYFLQVYGHCLWGETEGQVVSEQAYHAAKQKAWDELSQGFFHVRFNRATDLEKVFLKAMAAIGTPCKLSQIASYMDRTDLGGLGVVKNNLVKKGLIFSDENAFLDFTVPLFATYLNT